MVGISLSPNGGRQAAIRVHVCEYCDIIRLVYNMSLKKTDTAVRNEEA